MSKADFRVVKAHKYPSCRPITLHFDSGEQLDTNINGSNQEIEAYFQTRQQWQLFGNEFYPADPKENEPIHNLKNIVFHDKDPSLTPQESK